jgi:hypothetical protein
MKTHRKKLGRIGYWSRLYGTLRRANRSYSLDDDMARSPFPRVIQLQTINACQAACKMCPYPAFKDVFARGRMDDALFDKVTDEIARHPEVETFVPMLQNELFLDKHIFEKIARFKARTAYRERRAGDERRAPHRRTHYAAPRRRSRRPRHQPRCVEPRGL